LVPLPDTVLVLVVQLPPVHVVASTSLPADLASRLGV
jgi:hypothetical protein